MITADTSRRIELFLLEDLDQPAKTRDLSERDLRALRAVADWTRSFVIRPHRDLGRAGPVCPFVPTSLEHRTLWLGCEHSESLSTSGAIQLINAYKRQLLSAQPVDGDAAIYKSIAVVFPDLPASRAKDFFDPVLQQIAVPSYVDDGVVMGPFYEGNEGTAIYNPNFRPFTSPVPFLLMRPAVVSDWKFFLDNEEALGRWAHRYGEAGAQALAQELRRLPWRAQRS